MWIRYAVFFFFKQKTAYEMRISDWSSDVCSSDLPPVIVEKDVGVDSQPASECRGADEAFIIGDRFLFVDKTGERKLEAAPCAARDVDAADRPAECHGIAAAPCYRRAGRKRLKAVREINCALARTSRQFALLSFLPDSPGSEQRGRSF